MRRSLIQFFVVCAFFHGLMPASAWADTTGSFGIGAGLDGNGGSIYLPGKLGNIRVEPRISYSHTSEQEDSTGPYVEYDINSPSPSSETATTMQEWESTFKEISVGVFGEKPVTDDFKFYAGGRIGYLERDSRSKFSRTTVGSSSSSVWVNENHTRQHGVLVAPTLGFEYAFFSSVSIGAEVAIRYEKLSGRNYEGEESSYYDSSGPFESTTVSDRAGDADRESTSTQTHVIIRASF